jgi:phosphoadenosine phosphosulfate reductase
MERKSTLDKEDQEYMDRNDLADKFSSKRTDRCLELMKPEIRTLVDLPLEQKIEKSKEIIREAIGKYKNVGLGFSGGTDSLVLLHLALQIKHDIPVVFVDTIREFPENYQFVEETREKWGIENFTMVRTDKDRCDEYSAKLGYKTPEFMIEYCNDHKIAPMMKAIGHFGFDAFLVGLRGVEHEERAQEIIFSPRHNPEHTRVHPLLFWRREDILGFPDGSAGYVKKNGLTVNPLYAKGYTSLGCTVCSAINVDPNAHERAGRGIVRESVMKRLRELGYT